jgi:transketolase
MLKHQGPVYIRINRNDLPVYTSPEGDYEIGKMYRIREGKDVVIFATGAMVWKSMEAADLLAAEGVSAEVVNVSCVKPLKKEEVLKYTAGKKAIVTAEEATKLGGLGSAIASLIIGEVNLPFEQIGIDDEFGTSAHSYDELLVEYGLTEKDIAKAAKRALKLK